MDRSGSIIWANPAYSVDELRGRDSRMLCFSQHPPSFYEQIWKTILGGQVWHGKVTNRQKDGRLYTEQQTIIPMRNEQGEITHFVVIDAGFQPHAGSRTQDIGPELGCARDGQDPSASARKGRSS